MKILKYQFWIIEAIGLGVLVWLIAKWNVILPQQRVCGMFFVAIVLHIIEEMKNYIQKNYHYDIMLQDLADHFNLTAKYCGMLFARLSNDTFKNYLNAYRVEMAKQQIAQEPHIKINDLADKVGFNSATSFIRVFRKYTGTSPRLYADGVARIVRGETI